MTIRNKMRIAMKVSIAMIVLLSPLTIRAQNTAVSWSAFNMGFAETVSSTTSAQSVAGQLVVGSAQSATSGTESGFIPGVSDSTTTATTLNVTSVSDTGEGSLRWAMQTANTTPGLNIIGFNIPGSGVHTITPASALPALLEPTIIDGYTQPGSSPNTNPPELGSNAVLLIELNAVNAGGSDIFSGSILIRQTGSGSTIRGLVINRSPTAGISLFAGGNNTIEGNFIGTDPSGTLALPNASGILTFNDNNDYIGGTTPAARNVISGNSSGINFGYGSGGTGGTGHFVEGNLIGTNAAGTMALGNSVGVGLADNVSNTIIGGTTPEARNIISGNTSTGVSFSSTLGNPNVSNNVVQGNFIGTDVTGTVAIPNIINGVAIQGLNNLVGGITPGSRNVISGNGNGVSVVGGSGSRVEGNYIGTDVFGTSPLGNHNIGVSIAGTDLKIGGTELGAGNVIAFNGTSPNSSGGVVLLGTVSTRNAILGNSIFSNVGLGIDLGSFFTGFPDGVTLNDSCDADTLVPNNYQNYPVLSSVMPGSENTIVQGTLNSIPNNMYRIEFFSSSTPDSTGYGEGQTFLGYTTVVTGNDCLASFTDSSLAGIGPGEFITATATDMQNNTSEFSKRLQVGTTTSVRHEGTEIPTKYYLEQNYPNPFNPTTAISFSLPSESFVSLKVFDELGREVVALVSEELSIGIYSRQWRAGGLASGVYFYRLTAIPSGSGRSFTQTRKLILLR